VKSRVLWLTLISSTLIAGGCATVVTSDFCAATKEHRFSAEEWLHLEDATKRREAAHNELRARAC